MRQLAQKLVESRNVADGINNCVSRIERWSLGDHIGVVKVDAIVLEKLLNDNPSRCNEPGYKYLKVKCWKFYNRHLYW